MMVTIADAAKALGCSKANVYQRIKNQGIPTERLPVSKEYKIKKTVYALHVDLDMLKRKR